MYSVWTKHIKDADAKERFQNSVLGAKQVLDRAVDILNEAEADVEQKETSFKIYDTPNWEYRQAHLNGFKHGLSIAKKTLTLDQGK